MVIIHGIDLARPIQIKLCYMFTGRLVNDPNPNDGVSNIEAIIITDENQIKRNPKF